MLRKLNVFIRKEWALIVVIFLLAIITRFWMLGFPDRIVFDELYFAKFVNSYFLNSFYFDIHPPIAKLIMAGATKIAGINPVLSFGYNSINEPYPDSLYIFLRGIVSIFGSLLPVGVYLLSRSLSFSKKVSFLAGLFAVFDNALLVQSRFILTDAFLLTFGVFGLACVIFSLKNNQIKYPLLILGSILVGTSYSVKWTGLLFLGLSFLYIFIKTVQLTETKLNRIKYLIKNILIVLFVSFALYTSIMAIHIQQLYKTGDGDVFMSSEFQSTLTGNQNNISKEFINNNPSFVEKFAELNKRMLSANAGINSPHPYGSKWYTWPFMQRSIYYWQNTVDAFHEEKIYLLGNPIIWWGGLFAILYLIILTAIKYIFVNDKHNDYEKYVMPVSFLLSGYILNLLAYIPITRVAFLYHYFPSLIFLFIGLAYVLEKLNKKWLVPTFLTLVIIGFLFIAPLSYGYALTQDQFNFIMLLKSWI